MPPPLTSTSESKTARSACACSTPVDTEARACQDPARTQKHVFKKILVAVDHQHHAALQVALYLAAQLHAQVAVVYAFCPEIPTTGDNAYLIPESIADQRARAQRTMERISEDIPPGASAFTCLREGDPAREILSAADEWAADLIILGTHHKGALARLFLGSTSHRVLQNGHRPLLLVDDVASP